MTQITIDTRVADQLHVLTQVVELCDASGRVLGRFVPAVEMSAWEPLSAEISEAELDCREQSNEKRYTAAEVLTRLEAL